jgi:hypothetical protein
VVEPGVEWGVPARTTVTIRPGDIDKVYSLVKPTERKEGGAHKTINTLVATVSATHADGSTSRLFVRWMGKYPLAVSFDDEVYYWADEGTSQPEACKDGWFELVRFLRRQYPDKFPS